MEAMLSIRKNVFQATQAAFAAIAGVSQGTVSKWEAGQFGPSRDQLLLIRKAALAAGHEWRDEWFFEDSRVGRTQR